MKQVFNWIRDQIEDRSAAIGEMKIISAHNARTIINKAENNWEDDYCKTWKYKENNSFVQVHGTNYHVDDAKYWKCCPYCCRKIRVGVER